MNIIKLNAIDSTNSYLKDLCSKKKLDDYTVVMAEHQTNGRGQMGTVWQTESSKNLTISVFKEISYLGIENNYFISMATALGVCRALKRLQLPKLKVKWPNDILSENLKISGILIESIIKNNELKSAVLGIGINVNQKYFQNLPQASSLHLLTGKVYNIDEVLMEVLEGLKIYFGKLEKGELGGVKAEYEGQLFRLHKPSTFQLENGAFITGYINGVNSSGKLEVLMENAIIKTFDFKELKLLY